MVDDADRDTVTVYPGAGGGSYVLTVRASDEDESVQVARGLLRKMAS